LFFVSESSKQNQNPNDNESRTGYTLDPINREKLAGNGAHSHPNRRHGRQRNRGANENFPRPPLLRRHGHCSDLGLITQFRQKNYPESRQYYAPLHFYSSRLSPVLIAQIM